MASLFSKLTPLFKSRSFAWERDTIVFGIVVLLGVLAAALIAIDGYVLYLSHVREPLPIFPSRVSKQISEQEIDVILQLLDEREIKMRSLLGGAGGE